MRDDRMQLGALPAHPHMQQTALLEAVVGHIGMLDIAHRPARQQRIAMLAVAGDRIGAVGGLIALRREKLGLPLLRPAEPGVVEAARIAMMEQPHFLQEDQVRIQRSHAGAEVVDLQPAPRPHAAHALVDVVGGHPQRAGALGQHRLAPRPA